MKEKTLLKISLGASIVGIIVLFMLLQTINVDSVMISKLDELVDESVVVTGMVLDVRALNGTTFLMIEQNEITSVILFGETPMIETGDLIQVRGKVTEYKGEAEIIGEEVRVT